MPPNGQPQPLDGHSWTVPKKTWVQWSNRSHTSLDRAARLYGAPVLGPVVDVVGFIRWAHDLLAKHGRRLLAPAPNVELDGIELEIKREQLLSRRLERQVAERKLVDAGDQMVWLRRFADHLRNCGARLQDRFGSGALEIWNDSLEQCERMLDEASAAAPPPPGEPSE